MSYYYTDTNNQVHGPVTLEELKRLVENTEIQANCMVCAVESREWQPINTVLPDIVLAPAPSYDPFAILSFVLSLVGLFGIFVCCLAGIINVGAIIFGHISLINIKRKPHLKGRELAIVGLVVGYLGIALSVFFSLLLGGFVFISILLHP